MLSSPTIDRPEHMSQSIANIAAVRVPSVVEGGAGESAGERQRLFTIRAASSEGQRSSANILVNRMYAWRGYCTSPRAAAADAKQVTLLALDGGETVGTLSVGLDGPGGLFVDELFPDELGALRKQGRAICEFTKLAVDDVTCSRHVLASLFHVAYMHAHRLGGADDVLIEVNPRHVRYYQRTLGFETLGPARLNRRVNAPAILMALRFLHAREEIARLAGRGAPSKAERSLYPFFFSPEEESGILGRLSDRGSFPER